MMGVHEKAGGGALPSPGENFEQLMAIKQGDLMLEAKRPEVLPDFPA